MSSTRSLTVLFGSLALAAAVSAAEPVDYVSTLVGSLSTHELSTGNTYPAVAMPWGMNFWTPQTGKMGDGWTYTYTGNRIRGFKQTHQPSPWINDYGQFSLMPTVGAPVFDEESRASWFSHRTETASPHYYKVYLADHDVTAEIVPTERAALLRFTFPATDSANIVIDGFDSGSMVVVDADSMRVTGYTTKNSGGVPEGFRNWFVLEFDHPVKRFATVADGHTLSASASAEGEHAGAILSFSTTAGEAVTARVASSFISPEQARRNLLELGDGDFRRLLQTGRERWNDVLGRIEVKSPDVERLRTFYSCLYRSLLFPRALYEIDGFGTPVHRSPYNGKVEVGYMFTDTGFWDTFRSLFPLLNLVYPSVNSKIQQGLVHTYRESGFLPEWASPGHRNCMVGNNSASIVADAWTKGVRGFDSNVLWEAVRHGAENHHPTVYSTGRAGVDLYNRLGYVPCDADINENAARTLEYAYNDWCIYRLGQQLKRPKKEIEIYKKRALNYRNLFDPETGLMRGRNTDGTFRRDFNPLKWGGDFTEGNSWHYTWSVFHDPQGLIDLMGGADRFNAKLDSVFTLPPVFDDSYYGFVIHEIREMQIAGMGNYAHGNQPAQHITYLYNYSGQPWKTQYWVREVMTRLYSATPDGYCGDEDNGQTSAWYVFSALGFYPVCPATDQYVLGAPLFDSAVITFENGRKLHIQAPGNSDENRYINRLMLNNRPVDHNYLTHEELTSGGTLKFVMSSTPNLYRGIKPSAFPYSFSNDLK